MCHEALGMENFAISDGQISASSEWSSTLAAFLGRLHLKRSSGKAGSWSTRANDDNQWLQVDLGRHTKVTGIATQGRNGYPQWVTKYKLQYSNDGVNFQYYREQGQTTEKVNFFLLSFDNIVFLRGTIYCFCFAIWFSCGAKVRD